MTAREAWVDEAVRLYQAGLSVRDIADLADWPASRMRGALLRGGVEFRPPGRQRRVPYGDIARLYAKGLTIRQVAAEFGIACRTARKALIAQGTERRRRGRQPLRFDDPRVVLAQLLRREGATYRQIADALGLKGCASAYRYCHVGERVRATSERRVA